MEQKIGELAGDIWSYLEVEGKSSVSSVCRSVDAPRSKVNMAIGWLAREGKLEFSDLGRGQGVRLDEV